MKHQEKHDFSFGVSWNLSECLGVGHTVFGNRGSGSCRRAAVCSSVWLLAFVPWNAVIVGALIRAVTAAPLSCAAVPLPLCGCALSACFRLFQSSQLANPRRNCVKLLRWVKSASVEISRGLGGTFWAARLVKPVLPAEQWLSCSAHQEHLSREDVWSGAQNTLAFWAAYAFDFPHQEIHVDVLPHSSLD